MKTFLGIALVIALILGYLQAQSVLDQWNRAVSRANSEVTELSGENERLQRALKRPGTSAAEIHAALMAQDRNFQTITNRYEELYRLFQNKPFGIPLTPEEKTNLALLVRARTQQEEKRQSLYTEAQRDRAREEARQAAAAARSRTISTQPQGWQNPLNMPARSTRVPW